MNFGNLLTEQRFVLRHVADIDRSAAEPDMVDAVLEGVAQTAVGE